MANAPILVRTFVKSAGADADFAITQVAPAAALLWDVGGIQRIAVSFVPYTSAGAVSTGTLGVQLVAVNTPRPANGTTLPNLINGSAVTAALAVGAEVEYSVIGCGSVCVRVTDVAGLAGAVATCRIYIRPLS